MTHPSKYESTEILKGRVQEQLSQYTKDRIFDLVVESEGALGAWEAGHGLPESRSTIDPSQLSTFLNEEDDRFGYGLAVSPLERWQDRFAVMALYMKIDRERCKFAENPLQLALEFLPPRKNTKHTTPAQAEINRRPLEVMRHSRPGDGEDWSNVLRLLNIVQARRERPDMFPVDLKTMAVIIKESDHDTLSKLAENFGNKSARSTLESDIEGCIGEIFEDEQYRFDNNTVALKSVQPGDAEVDIIIERIDMGYLVTLLDRLDSVNSKRFAIGPYSDSQLDAGHAYGFASECEDEDLMTVKRLLLDGVEMTAEEFIRSKKQLEDIYELVG